jgi:hypothetical protein
MFSAMVRHMQVEAAAIRAQQAKTEAAMRRAGR